MSPAERDYTKPVDAAQEALLSRVDWELRAPHGGGWAGARRAVSTFADSLRPPADDAAAELLERYGRHVGACPRSEHAREWTEAELTHWDDTTEWPACECGFSAALSSLKPGAPLPRGEEDESHLLKDPATGNIIARLCDPLPSPPREVEKLVDAIRETDRAPTSGLYHATTHELARPEAAALVEAFVAAKVAEEREYRADALRDRDTALARAKSAEKRLAEAEATALEEAAKVCENVKDGYSANIRTSVHEQQFVRDPDGPWVLNSDCARAIRSLADARKGKGA